MNVHFIRRCHVAIGIHSSIAGMTGLVKVTAIQWAKSAQPTSTMNTIMMTHVMNSANTVSAMQTVTKMALARAAMKSALKRKIVQKDVQIGLNKQVARNASNVTKHITMVLLLQATCLLQTML
jgi:hypothetical protein